MHIFMKFQMVACFLVLCVAGLPLQPLTLQAASTPQVADNVTKVSDPENAPLPESQGTFSVDNENSNLENDVESTEPSEPGQQGMSGMGKVGIAVGAAAVVGVAAALAGGGSSGSSTSAQSYEPPTAGNLVSPWNASASSVENRSYMGVYHLYDGGALGYDLHLNDGSRKAGGGHWDINGYVLTLHNDTGTIYSGSFAPGNYSSITLYTTVGWTLALTR